MNQVEVLVGVVGRAHGIRGEAAVDVRTDEPAVRFAPGAELRSETGGRRFVVASARDHSGRLLVRFEGVADRTAVEALRGTRLVVDVDPDATPDVEDEYYDRQLVGLRVRVASGTEVGTVTAVVHLPQQDLLEVSTEAGVRLVPFVAALVPEVHPDDGWVGLADVGGLLRDEDE